MASKTVRPSLNRHGANRSRKKDFQLMGHNFTPIRHGVVLNIRCVYCNERIGGPGRGGSKCVNCNLTMHSNCSRFVRNQCGQFFYGSSYSPSQIPASPKQPTRHPHQQPRDSYKPPAAAINQPQPHHQYTPTISKPVNNDYDVDQRPIKPRVIDLSKPASSSTESRLDDRSELTLNHRPRPKTTLALRDSRSHLQRPSISIDSYYDNDTNDSGSNINKNGHISIAHLDESPPRSSVKTIYYSPRPERSVDNRSTTLRNTWDRRSSRRTKKIPKPASNLTKLDEVPEEPKYITLPPITESNWPDGVKDEYKIDEPKTPISTEYDDNYERSNTKIQWLNQPTDTNGSEDVVRRRPEDENGQRQRPISIVFSREDLTDDPTSDSSVSKTKFDWKDYYKKNYSFEEPRSNDVSKPIDPYDKPSPGADVVTPIPDTNGWSPSSVSYKPEGDGKKLIIADPIPVDPKPPPSSQPESPIKTGSEIKKVPSSPPSPPPAKQKPVVMPPGDQLPGSDQKPAAPQQPTAKMTTDTTSVPSAADFRLLKLIGIGSYAKVFQVEYKATKQILALKVMKKETLLSEEDIEWVQIEKHVHEYARDCPFLVNMYFCFQSQARLFFALEFVGGGDLMYYMQRNLRLGEESARFYIAEVCLAIDFLHSHGVIYRDLKLENVLIDKEGHIRLADYGMCKEGMTPDSTTNTFCGTPKYLSPEMLKDKPYGFSVDWWAVGVLLYEMLCGYSPFKDHDSETKLYEEILTEPIRFPKTLSTKAGSILRQFLQKDPASRLGAPPKSNFFEVKKQPFFVKLDWVAVEKRQVKAPMRPKVTDDFDLQNFDEAFTKQPACLTPDNKGTDLSQLDQSAFANFDYVNPLMTMTTG